MTSSERLDLSASEPIYAQVHNERARAHLKHHANGGSMEQKPWDHHAWLPVLTEEVGEVARVLCERELGNEPDAPGRLREELVQVAAMACAWIAALDADGVDLMGSEVESQVRAGSRSQPGVNGLPAESDWSGLPPRINPEEVRHVADLDSRDLVDDAEHEQRRMHEDQRCACGNYDDATLPDHGCVLLAEVGRLRADRDQAGDAITDLTRKLVEVSAERDEVQRRLDDQTARLDRHRTRLADAEAERDRLRDGIHKVRDTYERHTWAVEQGHDNEPDLGDQLLKAFLACMALLDDNAGVAADA